MKRTTAFIAACVCMIPAAPILFVEGKLFPDTSCPAVIDAWARIDALGRLYHDLKNVMTELFRCDAQWWAKVSGFTIWVLLIWAIVATVYALVQTKRGE